MDNIQVTKTIQQIINTDPSQVESILASLSADVRDEVRRQFRTNQKLRLLFPEYVKVATES